MTLSVDEQLSRAERRLNVQRQKLALEQKRLAMLERRKLGTKAGAERAEETRRKVLLGVALRRHLAKMTPEARIKVGANLAQHLSLVDQLVVADLLSLDPNILRLKIAAAGPAAHRVQGGNSHA